MRCLECNQTVTRLDNEHLQSCCGLTLQEYAIRHHMPLDGLVGHELLEAVDDVRRYVKPENPVSGYDRAILSGLVFSSALREKDGFLYIDGEIRRLDQLLWYLKSLQNFGFQYRQEYAYTQDTHRVVANNCLKVPVSYFSYDLSCPQVVTEVVTVATLLAHVGEYLGGYVFLTLPDNEAARQLIGWLAREYQIRMSQLNRLDDDADTVFVRTESLEDATRLLNLVHDTLYRIPCASERFFAATGEATVSKEVVFDAAHFITDHPGKCVNLHGGRYTMKVKVKGRIDPLTGFVVDYGYLKRVVKQLVVEQLDHHNLNYVATDIAWRSSTELLSIYIWEKLIDYLPGLYELQIHETDQSYCVYRGPSLEQLQASGSLPALKHFSRPELGKSALRSLIKTTGFETRKQSVSNKKV